MIKMIEMLVMAFTIGLTGALVPGPTLVATIDSSLRMGWIAGPKVAVGHALVELLLFLFIAEELALVAQQYSHDIAVLGGISLIVFGILTMKESSGAKIGSSQRKTIGNPYLAGIITSAANPYFWIWWLSIGSALIIDGLRGGLIMASLFMIGHWGADFGWYILVSASLDKGRAIISEASYHRILMLCGCFLVLFGFYYLIIV